MKNLFYKCIYHFILRLNKLFFSLFSNDQKKYLLSSVDPIFFSETFLNKYELFPDIKTDSLFQLFCKKIDKKILRNENYSNQVSLYTTFVCVNYLIKNKIKGDIIESGVANGRQVCLALEVLKYYKEVDFKIFLYDTFQGMVQPGKHDYKIWEKDNVKSIKEYEESLDENKTSSWQNYSLEQVKENIYKTEYPADKIKFVVGNVINTIPKNTHENISLLRLDTDFYDSTKVELEYLFPKVVKGGIIILDDYGAFTGVKKATDEYLKKNHLYPLLVRSSFKERVFIKS